MLTLALVALLIAVIAATALALADCWIRGRYLFESLREERALLDAGFVPMAQRQETRVRQPVHFDTLATPARLPSQRLAVDRSLSRHAAPGAA